MELKRDASKAEIKRAYHKVYGHAPRCADISAYSSQAALSSHPDKVPEDERAAADVRFKKISKAYEILYDEQKRHLYDTQGMSAFEAGTVPGAEGVNLDDILAQMMGMGLGGGIPPGFGGARPNKPRKGMDEEQDYFVTLEDLYKGKAVRFASTRNVICTHCKGSGGKERVKPKQCASCQGNGMCKAGCISQCSLFS